jgi:hypothetical protein
MYLPRFNFDAPTAPHFFPTFAGLATRVFARYDAVASCMGYVGCKPLSQKYWLSAYLHPFAAVVVDDGTLILPLVSFLDTRS